MFEKVVVVDAASHLLGRLASTVAKELLNGQKIVVVRCEELNISGSLFRNKLKFAIFLRKRTATNPTRGHWHYRSPARIFWRVVRGMIPHKTKRGASAMERLKVFEGIPAPFDRVKRKVVPQAMRVLRLKPGRKFCRVGDLASSFGWKHDGLIQQLETKRKTKSAAYYQTKKQLIKLRAKAAANVQDKIAPLNAELLKLGVATKFFAPKEKTAKSA